MSAHKHSHHAHAHHGHGGGSPLRTSAQATVHCLTGCVIGEVVGLAIGVGLGLGTGATIILATVLAYATGMTLGLIPVMRSRHVGLIDAFRIIWVGEVISIGVMEIVMNFVDYQMGGMGRRPSRGCSGAASFSQCRQVSWRPGRLITGY